MFQSLVPSYASNYVKGILDEIALEGLDGITPNDLWVRLNNRPYFPFKPNDEASKSFLWEAVKRLRSVSFYELPAARDPLVIYDRFENIDPEIGVIIESDTIPVNIYPHCKIEDAATGTVGSCSTYHTRKNVTEEVLSLSYQEVNVRWGHKLVVVASQDVRRRALQNPDVNPNLELTAMQYTVLERIGRSRYHGEITQGKDSLQIVGEDAKSLFYLRKVLHKHRLITKQMFHQKLSNQNTCGLLLHLPRFFVERRPKALTLTEKVVNYLKAKPNHMEELTVLREALGLGPALKKLSKTFNFQKFVKADTVLYRVMYPDAKESEWRYKGQNKEKGVRVMYLIDPNLDPKDVWQKYDDIYDDEEDEKCGLLDEGHRLLDRTMMAQAYNVLDKKGPEGATQVELGTALGASKLAARMLVRNLTKCDKVTMFMKDEGRQRTARFALKKFDKCSDLKKQMSKEKDKLLKFVNMGNTAGKENSVNVKIEVNDGTQHISLSSSNVNSTSEMDPQPSCSSQPDVTELPKMVSRIEEDVKEKGKKRKRDELDGVEGKAKDKKKNKTTEKTEQNKVDESCPVAANESQEGPSEEEIKIEITTPDLTKLTKRMTYTRRDTDLSNLKKNTISFRILKRTNMIMEAVHKQKVVMDTSKLQKMIYEEEAKEGYDVRMDKKSLLRIINKLSLEGHVKHLQMKLSGYGKSKTLTFICHPSVTTDHSVIQSALDQAKMKFQILGRETLKKKNKREQEVVKKQEPLPEEEHVECLHSDIPPKVEKNVNMKYSSSIGRSYGFKPKYMRMQVLHKYMFYLIYGYEGDVTLDQERALAEVDGHFKVTDSVKTEMSQIYTPTMDWKMFLPPLPNHSGYSEGWALMSDILLRLPLSLFIQVVNVTYEMPDIEEYLNHPIKRHFLVKNLPLNLRTILTYARKYIFTVHEQIVRLCCTGLLQMGPQRLKEKDQVFIYLNRRAVLWDTTSSPVGYHQIAKDREYPEHQYYFHTLADVEQYWYDLWNFCMHTMLGGRMCMSGKEVVLEGLMNKPQMVEALESRGVEEAATKDVGYLPGDHLGAACFDSSMFAHLKRNWYWNTNKANLGSRPTPAPAPTTDLQPEIRLPKQSQKEERTSKLPLKPLRVISETSSARRKQKRGDSRPEPKECQKQFKKRLIVKKTVRMLKIRKKPGRKPYYDKVDREALLKMSKLRVEWSAKEDNLLLLCKVAFVIFHYIGKRYQNLVVVRQILHQQCPEATDKTSRACQRRLNYMMKNSQTQRSVNLCVEEMKQDRVVMKKLKDMVEEMEKVPRDEREEMWADSYKQLVLLLQDRYKALHSQELSRVCEGFVLPDTKQELLENYRILQPQKLKKRGFNVIQSVSDVHAGVINSIILSSLNCIGDKTSWSYQLFNIYQQFPDKLLRQVMTKTRADQMVSLRKRYLRTHIRSGDYLPLSSSPYQLSISYINLLMTRYQCELYNDCLAMYQRLVDTAKDNGPLEEVVASRGGIAACIVELATQEQIEFRLDIPEQIIVMDPSVIKKDETYTRIVQRYKDILSKHKETEPVTMTAVFDEAFNSQSQDMFDEEEISSTPTVAKAATRIALHLTRDEGVEVEGVEQKEMQHVHDFFVVNASRVFCGYLHKDGEVKEDSELTALSKETISGLLNKIKRLAIFPDKGTFVPDSDIVSQIATRLGERQEFVGDILEFIRSKKEMGATVEEIRETYGVCERVSAVLSALMDAQACLRGGINKTHFVHCESHRPWVIRSYRQVRYQREGTHDPSRDKMGLLVNVGSAADDPMETDENKVDENKPEEPKEPVTDMEEVEPTPSTSSCPPPTLLPPRLRRPPAHLVIDAEDVVVDPHVKKSSAKFVSTAFRKVKKAPAFDVKAKCNLNVCVRPWIRINGSLNRRVLDKFLTSVLGHIMVVPLGSLKSIQDRFTPAFQPHHTRELIEMLAEIRCVRMLAIKHSHKPSLFSRPTTVSTVPATGLEREEDIVLEPDSMAITRLATFIGDTAYYRDIYTIDKS